MRPILVLVILSLVAAVTSGRAAAQSNVDAVALFADIARQHGEGIARKSRLVDVRPARPGEVIVTVIKGEGKETQSKPAAAGDQVVRNRCEETGNEEILVAAGTFARRYDGPHGPVDAAGYAPFRPRGVEMRFVVIPPAIGEVAFLAPWGEPMRARAGDVLVQDPSNPKDTYRIQKAAFACTYEILRPAAHPRG